MAQITLKGDPCNTCGDLPQVGAAAPDFVLVNADLADKRLADFGGKKILSIVPSLDTPTCALSTRKFNQAAAERADLQVLIVSADLPFAQGRFCTAENTGKVTTLSTLRGNFARDYGVLIEDGPLAGLTARAVLVLDEKDRVLYRELVPEIAQEPDYAAAVAAAG